MVVFSTHRLSVKSERRIRLWRMTTVLRAGVGYFQRPPREANASTITTRLGHKKMAKWGGVAELIVEFQRLIRTTTRWG